MPPTITYLEIDDPEALRPPERGPSREYVVKRVQDPDINRQLYEEIGAEWSWADRLSWPAERWRRWADQVETWVVEVDGTPAGYAELQRAGRSVYIAILGLRRPYRGQGLGGVLLTHVIRRAFELADRVWVTTSSLDGSAALPNYEARGMRVFRREQR